MKGWRKPDFLDDTTELPPKDHFKNIKTEHYYFFSLQQGYSKCSLLFKIAKLNTLKTKVEDKSLNIVLVNNCNNKVAVISVTNT